MRRSGLVAALIAVAVGFFWPGGTGIVFRRSLSVAAATVACSFPFGCLLGGVLARIESPFRRWMRLEILFLLALPLVIQATAWEACLGARGWLTDWLPGNVVLLQGWRGTVLVHAAAAIPWISLLVSWKLRGVSSDLEDETRMNASPWMTLVHGMTPHIGPCFWMAGLWVFLQTMGEMTVSDLFQVRTYAEELYLGYALDDSSGRGPLPSLSGGPLGLLVSAMMLFAALLLGNATTAMNNNNLAGAIPWGADRGVRGISLLAAAVLALLVGVPIGSLVYHAGLVMGPAPEFVRGWSLLKVGTLVARAPLEFGAEFFWTTLIGFIAALVGLVLATWGLCWGLISAHVQRVVWVITAITLALPATTLGVGLGRLFSQPWGELWGYVYDQTILAPVVVALARSFPVQVFLIAQGFRTVPQEHYELARLHGAAATSLLRHVVFPQVTTCLWVAGIAGFLLAAGELSASIVVAPPGTTTLPIRVFGLLHAGVEDRLSALCLSVALYFAVICGVLESIGKTWDDTGRDYAARGTSL